MPTASADQVLLYPLFLVDAVIKSLCRFPFWKDGRGIHYAFYPREILVNKGLDSILSFPQTIFRRHVLERAVKVKYGTYPYQCLISNGPFRLGAFQILACGFKRVSIVPPGVCPAIRIYYAFHF